MLSNLERLYGPSYILNNFILQMNILIKDSFWLVMTLIIILLGRGLTLNHYCT
jgi:hypothetical protein